MTALDALLESTDFAAAGERMHAFATELFPFCRSITGDGVRATLRAVDRRIPLAITEVPTRTPVFDWEIPREWNCRGGWIRDPDGRIVVDFADSNLHVMGYSTPVHCRLPLDELQPHLHSMPEHPDLIPYRTSYYQEAWAFCLPDRVRRELKPGTYEVCIDADLAPGALTYGECHIAGRGDEDVLLSCHVCHPSLANDNLSGIALATELGELLRQADLRHSYRLLFIPATIGSLAWLAANQNRLDRVRHGLVLTNVGDPGPPHYKRSRRETAEIDRAAAFVVAGWHADARVHPFSPYGYDERQFCAPGFNLPVGCLSRTPYGQYPQYHTSADNLDLIRPDALADSLRLCLHILAVLEGNAAYENLQPFGEPQLGRRGLYDLEGGRQHVETMRMAILWVLNQSDGSQDLLHIAERAALPFEAILAAARKLEAAGLIRQT